MANIRRKDSFFGLHSDFHAHPGLNTSIGSTLREEDICEICETLKPDFIQIDCKGHPGWASYPSKLGNAMPDFAIDNLKLWRKVTARYGIGLYMHYSGVYEVKYCQENPSETTVDVDGNRTTSIRFDGKYVDELLVPQICELASEYDIDGLWIDGDCWAVIPDFSPSSVERFEKLYGAKLDGKFPKERGDKYFDEYLEFTRNEFSAYLCDYIDKMHAKFPNLQICSNWAYSDHMPGPVVADVDYISGDLNPDNSFNSARYAGRMIALQNRTWDLMSWNFRYQVYKTPLIPAKTPLQVMQEAAEVISLGGAFQDNVSMFNDGSPNLVQMRHIAELSEFVRERKDFCFKGKFIHQAALLVSSYDRYAEMTRPYTREGSERLIATLALLCDSGISVETVSEHNLEGHYNEYPVIIVPEIYKGLPLKVMDELKKYVENGGSLLLIGAYTSEYFAKHGFMFESEYYNDLSELSGFASMNLNNGHSQKEIEKNSPAYFSRDFEHHGVVVGACKITPAVDFKTFGYLHKTFRSEGVPFACVFPFGKGKIGVIGADFGAQYGMGRQYIHRDIVKDIAFSLYTPLAKIEKALGSLELVCLEKNGRLMLQLVNANGHHSSQNSITEDFISPVLDIELSIASDAPASRLVLQPQGREIPFEYRNGRIYFSISRLDIHSVVEVIK